MMHSRRFVKWLLVVGVVMVAMLMLVSTQVQAQGCQYQFGFLELYNQIPQIVGPCRTNEIYDSNGNSYQLTANGMMMWRKSDGYTAFTNGYQTWVNGPCGAEVRYNTQRFPYEANPYKLPYVPSSCPAGNVMSPVQPVEPVQPIAPAPAATPEASIKFWADSETINKGECTTMHWDVQYIDRVYLDGEGVTGQGSQQVCPEESETYTLEVIHYGGSITEHEVTVEVMEP